MDLPNAPVPPEGNTTRPLLPAALLGPSSLLWLWILPLAVLFALNVQGYWLVEGNMSPEQHGIARILGLAGVVDLTIGFIMFWGMRQLRRRQGDDGVAGPWWGIPAIAAQVGYLWLSVSMMGDMLPSSVTVWIYPEGRYLFNQFAFTMLPLFHGILRLACARSSSKPGKALLTNLGLAISGPVALYLLFQSTRLIPLARHIPFELAAIGIVALGVAMFVGIVRGMMMAMRYVQAWPRVGERLAIVVFALGLPLGGLWLNRTIPFPVDFQTWEVYALVVVNAGLLLLASWRGGEWPRMGFGLLCATFPFSLYFFVVFLPYLPLSILAVIAIGTGFLVLTPTFLFTLHLHLLREMWRQALPRMGAVRLLLVGVSGALLLPAYFTLRAGSDRAALNAALDYVYAPVVRTDSIAYPGSLVNLRRALRSHRNYKEGLYFPFLSDYYAWLVFDNLVLPDAKLAELEQRFFGKSEAKDEINRRSFGFMGESRVRDRMHMPRATLPPRTVEIAGFSAKEGAGAESGSIVTLSLQLRNTGQTPAEFRQTLPLRAGHYISGFRLAINGQLVPGRIFEKKTALWVYAMIRDSDRRDPGLLLYQSPEQLELRVYPVNAGTPVTVEMDVLVPGKPDSAALQTLSGVRDLSAAMGILGRAGEVQFVHDHAGGLSVYGRPPQPLPGVERRPYLHLLIDRSDGNAFAGDLTEELRRLRARFPTADMARITMVNHDIVDLARHPTPLKELESIDARRLEQALPAGGGCALDLAIARAIRLHREEDLDGATVPDQVPCRPIFVIVSQKAEPRTLDLRLTDAWASYLPDLEIHELDAAGNFTVVHAGAATPQPLLRYGHSIRSATGGRPVQFAGSVTTFGSDERLEFWNPAASAWQPVGGFSPGAPNSKWEQAARLDLRQQEYARSPGTSEKEWPALIRESRESGILIPPTSYIVVENEAQWRQLALSERQKLGQNSALELLETPAPPAVWVLLGFACWIGWRERKRLTGWGQRRVDEWGGVRRG